MVHLNKYKICDNTLCITNKATTEIKTFKNCPILKIAIVSVY